MVQSISPNYNNSVKSVTSPSQITLHGLPCDFPVTFVTDLSLNFERTPRDLDHLDMDCRVGDHSATSRVVSL